MNEFIDTLAIVHFCFFFIIPKNFQFHFFYLSFKVFFIFLSFFKYESKSQVPKKKSSCHFLMMQRNIKISNQIRKIWRLYRPKTKTQSLDHHPKKLKQSWLNNIGKYYWEKKKRFLKYYIRKASLNESFFSIIIENTNKKEFDKIQRLKVCLFNADDDDDVWWFYSNVAKKNPFI